MKKYLVLTLIASIVLVSSAVVVQSQTLSTPKIKVLSVLGEGLAISADDSSDFKVVRIGLARVAAIARVNATNITEIQRNVGLLFLDREKYGIRNIQHGNGTASGDIYMNNSMVGTFDVSLVPKPGRDVWFGEMTLNNKDYNLYIVAAQRFAKAAEAAEHIREECRENPESCRGIPTSIRGIGNICDNIAGESCREKIVEYCNNNPTDRRCVFAFREYCTKHMEDHRCISELKIFCSNNPTDERCIVFCQKFSPICSRPITVESDESSQTSTGETETTTVTRNGE